MKNTQSYAKTVIVTGAGGGMGRACCKYLSELGWSILAIDRNQSRLEMIQSEGVHILCADLTDDDLLMRVQCALNALPQVWGLVNLAGVSQGEPIEGLSLQDWWVSLDANVTAAMQLTQLVVPFMKVGHGGSIINVGSPVGYIGARKPSYAASKAALHGLTMSCARNLGRYNIRVNMFLPGTTITEMTKDWDEARRKMIAEESLLGRLCTPEEIAEGIAFLLSDHSRYMSGSVLDMTCGSMWGH